MHTQMVIHEPILRRVVGMRTPGGKESLAAWRNGTFSKLVDFSLTSSLARSKLPNVRPEPHT